MTFLLKFLVIVITSNTNCIADPGGLFVPQVSSACAIDTVAHISYLESQNNDGLCYWKEGDFTSAEKCFRKAAAFKYSWGQYNLALCYFHGKGATLDLVKAANLMKLAAIQGNREAQATLGTMHHYGLGVEKNHTEALKWYQLAANAGNVTAFTYIGYLHQVGLGVPKNYTEALKWYQLAANKGCVNAMQLLGGLYETGHGVEKNTNVALKWYRAAAELSDSEAAYHSFRIYYYELSDTANGFNYLTQAAAQNHVGALYELAEVYYFGLLGRSVDRQKALTYYQKAAEGGNVAANMTLKVRNFSNPD